MKVARISTVPFFVVTQLQGQIEFLSRSGMEVTVITSNIHEISAHHFLPDIEYLDVAINRRPSLLKDLFALVRLILIYRKHRFDIVHSTTPKAGLLSSIAAKISGVPISLHTFTGQPWVTMTGMLRLISRTSDKLIGNLNTHCYADSPSQRQYLIDEGIIANYKISVIGDGSLSGVDIKRFDKKRFPIEVIVKLKLDTVNSMESIVITFIGRITPDKGIFELLHAFNYLCESDGNVELVLVGPIDQGKENDSLNLYSRIQNSPNVHWVNYTDAPENYLAFTDILCLPSYREGFGTVVIEAAAMGIPTVGTKISGLSDAIIDGVTGLLVPVADSDALLNALKHLIKKPDERNRMGVAAHKRCVEKFDSDSVNNEILNTYIKLMGTSIDD